MIFTLFLREDEITTRWWVVVTHPLGSLHSLDPQEQFSSADFVKCQREAVPRQRLAPEVMVWCCPLPSKCREVRGSPSVGKSFKTNLAIGCGAPGSEQDKNP